MVSIGRTDLVPSRTLRQKSTKKEESEQGLGCSDKSTVILNTKANSKPSNVKAQLTNNINVHSEESHNLPKTELNDTISSEKNKKISEYQSTGDQNEIQNKDEPINTSKSNEEKSKTLLTSIKSFFKFQSSLGIMHVV